MQELLPDTVVAVETFGEQPPVPLFPAEEAALVRAADKRRREFTAVRGCARRAMERLGAPVRPLPPGEGGAPEWPEGLTGSMTHCDGYRAAALVRAADLASLGIDAEPHAPLPEGVLGVTALPAEAERLRQLTAERPGVHWDRLLFSAKESVYKAWYPLTRRWLDFTEADIAFTVGPDGTSGTLTARLLVAGPLVGGRRVDRFTGRWTVRHGLAATAVTVPHRG